MSLPFIDMADAYQNGAYIPGAEGFPPRWTAQARAFRDEAQGALDLAYGDHPRARFDLFRPRGAARGLAVFVHGGYWMDFDKSSWSHLAAGAVARGWAVALPSYPLAPEVRLHEITRQVAAAISRAATLVDGRSTCPAIPPAGTWWRAWPRIPRRCPTRFQAGSRGWCRSAACTTCGL